VVARYKIWARQHTELRQRSAFGIGKIRRGLTRDSCQTQCAGVFQTWLCKFPNDEVAEIASAQAAIGTDVPESRKPRYCRIFAAINFRYSVLKIMFADEISAHGVRCFDHSMAVACNALPRRLQSERWPTEVLKKILFLCILVKRL
jgi:hypothetical protein